MHISTKTYGHGVGLSACFRQWRADSHCNQLHGYALAVTLTFGAERLDKRNWVVDFGGLDEVRAYLRRLFDHRTVVAEDDPALDWFEEGRRLGVIDLLVLPSVGCEAFAHHIYEWVAHWLEEEPSYAGRVSLLSVEVREHEANSALYQP